jgi:C4-dicarboxylate-specific signal transduction histidine kinase
LNTPLGNGRIAVTNLIDNCLRYAFKDRERGSVAISATRLGDNEVTILLRDDGFGMTPEVARRAFDPFFTTSMGRGEPAPGCLSRTIR